MKKIFFGISAVGVKRSRTRKKLAASHRECSYNRTGEPSETFCEKEALGSGRMAPFLLQTKNKPEQSELCSGLVRETGLEPVRHGHTPLKRACLPVPALALNQRNLLYHY